MSEIGFLDPLPVALHVESYGAGPALVLAHGFGGSSRNFRALARSLRSRFRLVLYDARGHAKSDAPPRADAYRFADLVADFGRVAHATEQEPIIGGGLSLGAATALHHALEHPDRVRALVLAAYPAGGDAGRQWALQFADAIEQRGVADAGGEFVWGARTRFDDKGASFIRQGFMEHPPHALAHLLRHAIAELPSADALAHKLAVFPLPTLIVVGSEDRASLASSQRLATVLPHAVLEVIDGAGHVVNLSQPRAFAHVVERFLDDIVTRQS